MQPLEHLATLLWPEANPKRSHASAQTRRSLPAAEFRLCPGRYAFYEKPVSSKTRNYAYYPCIGTNGLASAVSEFVIISRCAR